MDHTVFDRLIVEVPATAALGVIAPLFGDVIKTEHPGKGLHIAGAHDLHIKDGFIVGGQTDGKIAQAFVLIHQAAHD